jgi:hypothetical protein
LPEAIPGVVGLPLYETRRLLRAAGVTDRLMSEWLVEHGIGEDRAILVDGDEIVAARVAWDEAWRAGAVAEARLVSRIPGTRRAVVRCRMAARRWAKGSIPR